MQLRRLSCQAKSVDATVCGGSSTPFTLLSELAATLIVGLTAIRGGTFNRRHRQGRSSVSNSFCERQKVATY